MFERLSDMSNNTKLYDEATKVTAEDGEVVLDGPDGVDVALTPEAALETGGRLIDQAAVAAGQNVRLGSTIARRSVSGRSDVTAASIAVQVAKT